VTTACFGLLQPELAELDPEVKHALITLYSTFRVRYRVCALGPAAHTRYLVVRLRALPVRARGRGP
jgi:hypothetical protein